MPGCAHVGAYRRCHVRRGERGPDSHVQPPGPSPPHVHTSAGLLAPETDQLDVSVPEQVLLDENEEAKHHKFYMVGGFEVSPNHK